MERAEAGEIEVRVEDADDLDAVYAELRGVAGITAQVVPAPVEPGDQGSVADLLTVACTSGAVTALLQIIKALVDSRGPGFRLRVRRGRQQVEITARDPDKGLAALKDLLDGS
jgi:Effector Associated Constant Component 1